MTFRLPRLNAADRMVTSEGRPAPFFLRFFNIDWAGAIERQEASQAQILAQLQAVQQAQQDEIDRLNRVLAGEESFTGLNVGGTDVKPFLDKTDGEKLVETSGLDDDLVETAEVATGAINQFTSTYTDGNVDISSALGWVVVATIVVTTIEDETVDLDGSFSFSRDTSITAPMGIHAAWFKDGVQMAAQSVIGDVQLGSDFTMPNGQIASKINDTPGAATTTYTLRAQALVTAGSYTGVALRRYARALTMRKPG